MPLTSTADRTNRRDPTLSAQATKSLRQDPVRKEIFAALQQWHDRSQVGDDKIDSVREQLKALPYEWRAQTGHTLMAPAELRFLPIDGGPAAVTADGWVHVDFTEEHGSVFRILPKWLDNALSPAKTYHLKFNIFEQTLRVVER
jgi:hypothetical protein